MIGRSASRCYCVDLANSSECASLLLSFPRAFSSLLSYVVRNRNRSSRLALSSRSCVACAAECDATRARTRSVYRLVIRRVAASASLSLPLFLAARVRCAASMRVPTEPYAHITEHCLCLFAQSAHLTQVTLQYLNFQHTQYSTYRYGVVY